MTSNAWAIRHDIALRKRAIPSSLCWNPLNNSRKIRNQRIRERSNDEHDEKRREGVRSTREMSLLR